MNIFSHKFLSEPIKFYFSNTEVEKANILCSA